MDAISFIMENGEAWLQYATKIKKGYNRSGIQRCMCKECEVTSTSNPCKKILMFVDQASFHSSKGLKIPSNIRLFPILAHSLELNPVEVLWKYIRSHFFKNEIFDNIEGVVDRLCDAFKTLADLPNIIRSISAWDWIIADSFN